MVNTWTNRVDEDTQEAQVLRFVNEILWAGPAATIIGDRIASL